MAKEWQDDDFMVHAVHLNSLLHDIKDDAEFQQQLERHLQSHPAAGARAQEILKQSAEDLQSNLEKLPSMYNAMKSTGKSTAKVDFREALLKVALRRQKVDKKKKEGAEFLAQARESWEHQAAAGPNTSTQPSEPGLNQYRGAYHQLQANVQSGGHTSAQTHKEQAAVNRTNSNNRGARMVGAAGNSKPAVKSRIVPVQSVAAAPGVPGNPFQRSTYSAGQQHGRRTSDGGGAGQPGVRMCPKCFKSSLVSDQRLCEPCQLESYRPHQPGLDPDEPAADDAVLIQNTSAAAAAADNASAVVARMGPAHFVHAQRKPVLQVPKILSTLSTGFHSIVDRARSVLSPTQQPAATARRPNTGGMFNEQPLVVNDQPGAAAGPPRTVTAGAGAGRGAGAGGQGGGAAGPSSGGARARGGAAARRLPSQDEGPIELSSDDDDDTPPAGGQAGPSRAPGGGAGGEGSGPRRSQRIAEVEAITKQSLVLQGLRLRYPANAPPGKSAVDVLPKDLDRLEEAEFLNDTIMDFYIKYLEESVSGTGKESRYYFFNSFFYKKLTEQAPRKKNTGAAQASPLILLDEDGAEAGPSSQKDKDYPVGLSRRAKQSWDKDKRNHERVKKWTKRVDIFKKEYVFVPIHDAIHWSLAIICHPGNWERSAGEPEPIILHLDSMKDSECHPSKPIFNALRGYLTHEWLRNSQEEGTVPHMLRAEGSVQVADYFIPDRCKDLSVTTVPQQPNHCDCGLYVLAFIEFFIHGDPDRVTFDQLKSLVANTRPTRARGDPRQSTIPAAKPPPLVPNIPEFMTSKWFDEDNGTGMREYLRYKIFELMALDLEKQGQTQSDQYNYLKGRMFLYEEDLDKRVQTRYYLPPKEYAEELARKRELQAERTAAAAAARQTEHIVLSPSSQPQLGDMFDFREDPQQQDQQQQQQEQQQQQPGQQQQQPGQQQEPQRQRQHIHFDSDDEDAANGDTEVQVVGADGLSEQRPSKLRRLTPNHEAAGGDAEEDDELPPDLLPTQPIGPPQERGLVEYDSDDEVVMAEDGTGQLGPSSEDEQVPKGLAQPVGPAAQQEGDIQRRLTASLGLMRATRPASTAVTPQAVKVQQLDKEEEEDGGTRTFQRRSHKRRKSQVLEDSPSTSEGRTAAGGGQPAPAPSVVTLPDTQDAGLMVQQVLNSDEELDAAQAATQPQNSNEDSWEYGTVDPSDHQNHDIVHHQQAQAAAAAGVQPGVGGVEAGQQGQERGRKVRNTAHGARAVRDNQSPAAQAAIRREVQAQQGADAAATHQRPQARVLSQQPILLPPVAPLPEHVRSAGARNTRRAAASAGRPAPEVVTIDEDGSQELPAPRSLQQQLDTVAGQPQQPQLAARNQPQAASDTVSPRQKRKRAHKQTAATDGEQQPPQQAQPEQQQQPQQGFTAYDDMITEDAPPRPQSFNHALQNVNAEYGSGRGSRHQAGHGRFGYQQATGASGGPGGGGPQQGQQQGAGGDTETPTVSGLQLEFNGITLGGAADTDKKGSPSRTAQQTRAKRDPRGGALAAASNAAAASVVAGTPPQQGASGVQHAGGLAGNGGAGHQPAEGVRVTRSASAAGPSVVEIVSSDDDDEREGAVQRKQQQRGGQVTSLLQHANLNRTNRSQEVQAAGR